MTWFEMLQRECNIFGKNVFDFDTPPPEEVTAGACTRPLFSST
jgi:hypothetical protein